MPLLRTALAAATLIASAAALPALADKPGDHDTTKTSSDTQTRDCSGGTVTLAGPTVLWPPNHKMVDEVGTATSKQSGLTTLTLNAAGIDDVSGGDGSPSEGLDSSADSTNSDTDGSVSTTYQVRAERSGKGDGRTYTINWAAQFADGSMCSSKDNGQTPFEVTVPHDQGNHTGQS